MIPRRARLTDFSLPLGVAAVALLVAAWGWRMALVVVAAAALVVVAGRALLSPLRERPRGTTMDVGDRPLLVYLYSPY